MEAKLLCLLDNLPGSLYIRQELSWPPDLFQQIACLPVQRYGLIANEYMTVQNLRREEPVNLLGACRTASEIHISISSR